MAGNKTYEVSVVERHLITYIVEARDNKQAEEIARRRYEDGEAGETLGHEWGEIERLSVQRVKS
jgi:hypothetical protein